MSTEIKAESYDGFASKFDDSRFINFTTLCGLGGVTLTISEVLLLKKGFRFENGQTLNKDTLTLKFEGKEKALMLNTGRRKAIIKLYGNKTSGWVGQDVILWSDPTVKFAGKEVGGVKVMEEQS